VIPYFLLPFAGVFAVQWGIGLAIDDFQAPGSTAVSAFQKAIVIYLLCAIASHAYFLMTKSHNQSPY